MSGSIARRRIVYGGESACGILARGDADDENVELGVDEQDDELGEGDGEPGAFHVEVLGVGAGEAVGSEEEDEEPEFAGGHEQFLGDAEGGEERRR